MSKNQKYIESVIAERRAADAAAATTVQQKNRLEAAARDAFQKITAMQNVRDAVATMPENPALPQIGKTSLPSSAVSQIYENKAEKTKKEYDAYKASEEAKKNKQEATRKALEFAMAQSNYAPGTQMFEKPKEGQIASPAIDYKEKELKASADYYQNQADLAEDTAITAQNLKELASWSEEDRNALNRYIAERDAADQNIFGEPQFDMYNLNPIIQKYGYKKVAEMAESVKRQRNKVAAAQAKAAAEKANPILGSVASIGTSLIGAVTAPVEYLKEFKHRTGQYSTLDPNNIGTLPNTYGGTVLEETAQKIQGDGNNWLRNLAAMGYQGFMSAADSAARLAVSAGNPGVSALIAAGGGFGNGLQKYSQQGASPEQAAAMALLDSGIEYATEKLSDAELLDFFKHGKDAKKAKDFLWHTFGVEPLSEEVALFAGTAAEMAVLGEKSSQQQKMGELIANGMSYEEAKAQVMRELWAEAGQTYAISAISAGIGSYGAYEIGGRVNTNTATQTEQQAQEAPVEPVSEVEQIAQRAAEMMAQPKQEATAPTVEPEQAIANALAEVRGKTDTNTTETTSAVSAPVTQNTEAERSTPIMETQKPSAEGTQIKGTGAAEANFTGRAQYQEMLSDENSQPDRPGDVRPMEVLRTDAEGKRVSDTAANLYGAEITPDEMANRIQNLIQDGALGFDTRTNRQSLQNAYEEIWGKDGKKGRGAAATEKQISNAIEHGKVRDGDIEKAIVLYDHYANQKSDASQERAAELVVDLASLANMTGRNLQLFKLIRKMTPQGQLYTVQKNISRYVESINHTRSARKQADVVIPEELEQALLTATTDKQRQEATDAIYKNVASQMKPTLGEMWDAWRNLAMLGNVKTHLRNIAGSAAFTPYVNAKRIIGAGLEKIMVEQSDRTKAVLGWSDNDKALLDWAKSDGKTDNIKGLMDYSGTTGNEARTAIDDYRQILPGKLDDIRKWNMEKMENADMRFKQSEYSLSLASFLKARGYTAEQVKNGQVPQGVLNQGRQLAVKESMKATFNDRNRFSDAIAKMKVKGSNPMAKAANALIKGVLPFRRTPANVVVRSVEYSPAGIANAIYTAAVKVKSGDATMSDVVDQLAGGLTGTGAALLGAALAAGIIPGVKLVGKIDEDEEREGAKEYSLKVGDNYYGIEWLAPANMPLFVGANLLHRLQQKEDAGEDIDGWDIISGLFQGAADILDPMLELSMMSSLNDIVDNMAYEESAGDKLISVITSAATSYLTQGLPTIFGQLEQSTETTKTITFANADNPMEREWQRFAGRASQRIPGLDLHQTEKVDEFGNVVQNEGTPLERAFNAIVNPFTVTKQKDDPVIDEIAKLRDAAPDGANPPEVPKKISYTNADGEKVRDHRLTAEEYNTYSKVQGQTIHSMMEECLDNDSYKAMPEKLQAKVRDYIYDYARENGRSEALQGYTADNPEWMNGIDPANEIMNHVVSSSFTGAFNTFTSGKEGAAEQLDNAVKLLDSMPAPQKQQVLDNAEGRVEYFLEANKAGMSGETFLNMYEKYRAIDDSAKDIEAKANDWAYALDQAQKAGTITQKQKQILKESMQFRFTMTSETEKYDTMIESGVKSETALDITKLIKDTIGTGEIDPATKKRNVRSVDKYQTIAGTQYSDADKDKIMKAYMPDYDPNDKSPDKTELKYDTVRKLGYSPDEYADSYRAYLDADKKAEKIRAIMAELGCSNSDATQLYKIYYGSYFK